MLLVEADRDLAALFTSVLLTHSERVVHAATTDDALCALERDDPDVVVVDVDGLQRPFALLQVVRRRAMVVLAGSSGALAERAKTAGMRWVFEKPVNVETLLTAVATAAPT